jgi:poly [ADP-ribose] polymerase
MASVVESVRLIKTDIQANNNKWWEAKLHDDHSVHVSWGRVGDTGQSQVKTFGDEWGARRFLEGKQREKEGKGYRPQQTLDTTTTVTVGPKHDVAELAQKQIQTSCPETARLVTYLSERNVHAILAQTTMSYDSSRGTFSTPLGIVTGDAIRRARNLLSDIGLYVQRGSYTDPQLIQNINDYMMLVPQNVGRQRPEPSRLYPNLDAVQKQNALLDALEASLQQALSSPKPVGTPVPEAEAEAPVLFQVKLQLVEDGKEIDRIRKKYRETRKAMHECYHLDVKKVYLVEIGGMRAAFEKDGVPIGNIWELWHGTRVGNLLSIMKGGFTIPPSNAAHCTGRLFGNGMYHSDQSTKSLNYAYGYWDGGKRDDNCFMFLNNVAMGNIYHPKGTYESLPKPGFDSSYAKGGEAGVQNNEMIVYKTAQVDPVFLVEFSREGK